MGRWAQRTRGGGGIGGGNALNRIVINKKDSFTQSTETYLKAVNAASFSVGDWISTPGGATVTNIAQGADNKLVLTWDDIETETGLTYTGVAVGVQTPQSLNFT